MTASPRRWARNGRGALLVATIAAAAAGVGIATVLVPSERARSEPKPSNGVLATDITRLPLPQGWALLRRSRIPGLERAPTALGLYSEVAIDTRMPDDASLLPAPLLRALAVEAPKPELIRSGSRVAWSYRLRGPGNDSGIIALAIPTTRGVVCVVCLADAVVSPLVETDCDAALAALELVRAAPLRPAPETAARLVAGPAIATLDGERRDARRALASARSPGRRAAAAARLAAAYGKAARRLEPLARGAARPLPRALDRLARDYRALARASARRYARAARRAGRSIDRRERRLVAQLSAAAR